MTAGGDRQRIDKWLWFARMVKTRALAQDLAESGKVRLNGRKIASASQALRIGDVLTFPLAGRVRVLRVAGFAERRGSYPEALKLYEDLTPPAPAGAATDVPPDDDDTPAPLAPGGEVL